MKFYRPLSAIKAMTFDLDDTLYDNYPVIRRTTLESHAALQAFHPALRDFTPQDYQQLRDELLQREPDIYHDVSEWRRRSVELAMLNIGLSAAEATAGAAEVMAVFHQWRSQVEMPDETHQTLKALAEKIPLVAVTNGNACPEKWALQNTSASRCGPGQTGAPSRGRICISLPRNALISRHTIFCTWVMT